MGGKVSDSQKAAGAFERLLAFDPDHAARSELRGAGISESAVQALYPDGGFYALESRIIARISGLANERLLAVNPYAAATGFGVWQKLPSSEAAQFNRLEDDYYALIEAAPEGSKFIVQYLRERFITATQATESQWSTDLLDRRAAQGEQLAEALRAAYWLMPRRAALAPETRTAVEQLMLHAAHGAGLVRAAPRPSDRRSHARAVLD